MPIICFYKDVSSNLILQKFAKSFVSNRLFMSLQVVGLRSQQFVTGTAISPLGFGRIPGDPRKLDNEKKYYIIIYQSL